ncbi:hypothetical protein CEUSTIGMA_g14068.t1, partial [Chlamydomonas eustigma]
MTKKNTCYQIHASLLLPPSPIRFSKRVSPDDQPSNALPFPSQGSSLMPLDQEFVELLKSRVHAVEDIAKKLCGPSMPKKQGSRLSSRQQTSNSSKLEKQPDFVAMLVSEFGQDIADNTIGIIPVHPQLSK